MTLARSQFAEALDALRVDVDLLGSMAQDAVTNAVAALVGDQPAAAQAVIQGDDRIDALFVALEERAYGLIAQQAPVAADLRLLVSALRVMADYEKTGDRAIAVAKTAFEEWERQAVVLTLLARMGDLSLGLLDAAREAWLGPDLVVASDLKRRDDTLDATYRSLVSHLLSLDGAGSAAIVLHAHAAGRNLERIADHAVMIGERVSYLVTGDPSALAAEIA
jgi:phosphate transport system protein